jgi:tRNA pseudouridine38-40 synthase
MKRFFIHFCYDGTNYHGWQIQPNGNSVQEELQNALSLVLRTEMAVVGAGRTDAGVHARRMVAHFDFEGDIDCPQLAYRLNKILPRDISVSAVEPVAADMHARFSATRRTYHYYIHTRKNPFLRHYSCELHYPLDFEAMNVAASHLLEVNDFGAFCKSHTDVKTTLCDVTEAEWIDDGDGCWHFRISANRFLRNMVRAVVGTLIDVGRHRVSLDEFDTIVSQGNRSSAGESMPAHALFLEDISY